MIEIKYLYVQVKSHRLDDGHGIKTEKMEIDIQRMDTGKIRAGF